MHTPGAPSICAHFSLHIFLPNHERNVALIAFEVALIVAEAVDVAGFSSVFIGEVAEFEASFHQFIAVDLGFAVRIEFSEDTAILAEDVVDIADEVGGVAIEAVVVGAAALVRAEALVRPAGELLAAFFALFFHSRVVM